MNKPKQSFSIAVCMALALTACGSGSGTTADGKPEINVILNGNSIGEQLKSLIKEFSEEHGIKVNAQVLAEQQMRDKEQLNLQSQSKAMDVYMTLPSREGPLFSTSEYYEPLDDYIADADADYAAEEFSDAAIEGMTIDDKVVAAPMNVEGPLMYYRTDILKEEGIPVPETIDDLVLAAEKLKANGDDSYVPVTLRGQADALAYDFGAFFHAQGLDWTTDGKPNFDDSKAVEAIDQYATLAAQHGPDGVVNYSFNESTNLFASGGAAIMLESSNLLPTIINPTTSKVADKTGVATFPGGEPAQLSWGLAISPFSEQKDAAWEFVQWATGSEVQLELALGGIAPPRSSLFEDPEYVKSLDTDLKSQWRDALLYVLENGNTEVGPVGEEAPGIRKVIGDEIGMVILGQKSAEDAAKSLQDQLDPLLADQQ